MTPEMKRTAYSGFTDRELSNPLYVGRAVEACLSKDRDAVVNIVRYRSTNGDFNAGFFKAIRRNDNQPWTESVQRASIVQVGIEWVGQNKNKLSFKTKKQLGENSSAPCILEKNGRKHTLKMVLG